MSSVNYKDALARIVGQMRDAGYSTSQIITLILGETPKATAVPVTAPETERLVSIELANGITKLMPASAVPVKANTHAVVTANCQVAWVPPTPDWKNTDMVAAPAPKPVVSNEHQIVFTPSRSTTHDAQVASYQEPWTGPSATAEPDEDDVDLDALIAEQEADLAKLRTLRGSK